MLTYRGRRHFKEETHIIYKEVHSTSIKRMTTRGRWLKDARFRVDVQISSSQVKKVLKPVIYLTLKTSKTKIESDRARRKGDENWVNENEENEEDGETIEMSVEMFNALRESVAKMLVELEWAEEDLMRV